MEIGTGYKARWVEGTLEVCIFVYTGDVMQSLLHLARTFLLVIPKTLVVNTTQDSTNLAQLRAYHNASQIDPNKVDLKCMVSRCVVRRVT